ncbi:phosphoadenosine phosphosulfate reductase family protein [Oricola thermophila]|uniref:Phosphoadenosine phosphosulfate reductase family protein n=1 Tax=Oricola thermophila TaxID=2742145 RepID=A0A6N1VAA5_9HYPH|nr:phosphoadenosine phosphosulfate reductase family protein [Oricola thermophila]QKV17876.1 phosphoadenosine phosphosulfate reductase family protein [Oricola thermophila]
MAFHHHYRLPEGNVHIAFSGGRTSAYMLHCILEANGDLPDRVKVTFQNTGREMPETLDFIQECSERWRVPIIWLEYMNEPPRYKVVNHNSASRNGEPFEELIKRRGFLPNRVNRFCSVEMKVHTSRRYLVACGWSEWTNCTGIRADEPNRRQPKGVKVKGTRHYAWQPLIDAGVTKRDVAEFWASQTFDLRLPNVGGNCWLGNCDGCFLKSEKNQAALAREFPERHAWWERMEKMAENTARLPNGARFREEWSKYELRQFIERQGDWIFDDQGILCQAEAGECAW